MNTNFQRSLAKVLKYEGGWSNDPRDPGGATYQGVTQRVYDTYRRAHSLGARTVHAMETAERDAIYRTGYWNSIAADMLPSGLDLAAFDASVNSGPGTAVRWLKGAPKDSVGAIKYLCSKRLSFLHSLKTWSHFGTGWARRVSDVEATALSWASGSAAPQVLKKASDDARAKATKAGKAAAGHSVGGGTVATAASTGHHWVLVVSLVAVTLSVAAYFIWKANQHKVRSEVLAQPVVAPVVPKVPVITPPAATGHLTPVDQINALKATFKHTSGASHLGH
ncbi:glycosyl hydrolase 108 family protein [Thiothrix sp.]|uniref:glycoside hydrolase family 108 protein n=1 Tax=Thiothrix sp. TaxID=1032 RepID=UPI0034373E81